MGIEEELRIRLDTAERLADQIVERCRTYGTMWMRALVMANIAVQNQTDGRWTPQQSPLVAFTDKVEKLLGQIDPKLLEAGFKVVIDEEFVEADEGGEGGGA